ncbi:HET-domain-containing protein, partial [Decorospora gaudefroyi]
MEPFVHCPLDLSKDEIRLARVTLPAPEIEEQRQEPVRIVLETFDRRTSPSYSALSYTWGPPSPSHGIVANDRPFTIRNNLYCFLRRLASGSIRYPATENDSTIERHPGPNGPNHEENAPLSPVYLWIDQLCIDQDSTTEKSSQVSKMTEIFMEAKEVIVWLGEEQDDSNFAMRCITQIPRAYKPWTIVKPDNNIPATVKMRARSSTTQVPLEEVVRSIQTLMNRPYWNRVWVAQE